MRRFLRRYPNPTILLDAPEEEVQQCIVRPLGLADVRYRAVSGMSRTFLAEVRPKASMKFGGETSTARAQMWEKNALLEGRASLSNKQARQV